MCSLWMCSKAIIFIFCLFVISVMKSAFILLIGASLLSVSTVKSSDSEVSSSVSTADPLVGGSVMQASETSQEGSSTFVSGVFSPSKGDFDSPEPVEEETSAEYFSPEHEPEAATPIDERQSPLSISRLSPIQLASDDEDIELPDPSSAIKSPFKEKEKEGALFTPQMAWENPHTAFNGFEDQFSEESVQPDESLARKPSFAESSVADGSTPMRRLSLQPSRAITGRTHSIDNPSAIHAQKASALKLNEKAYLETPQNVRGTRVWNFRYLDEATVFHETPSYYSFGWFWQRWTRRLMHLFQPRHSLVHRPQSIDASIRSSKLLPLPLLQEAAKFISFITPDGHVANYKNIALQMNGESGVFPQVKVVVHLYTNQTAFDNVAGENSFQFSRTALGKNIPVSPANPFSNVKWATEPAGEVKQEKWMRLVLKAARQLYTMLVLDSVMYSEYQHDLYSFLWDNVADDGTIDIPELPACACSMFYINPFESAKDNISFVLDDSIPLSFHDEAELLPSASGPLRNAQVSALSKEYYALTIQLIDVIARIQSNIDSNYMRHIAESDAPSIAYLRTALGRIAPSANEGFPHKTRADGDDLQHRKEEFIRENGVQVDASAVLRPRHRNAFPMIHFVFDNEMPSVGEEMEGPGAPRLRSFGPMHFCGSSFYRQRALSHRFASDDSESFHFSETVRAPSALKLSAPLGPSQTHIHLDIVCPCVPCKRDASVNHIPLADTDFSSNAHLNPNVVEDIHRVHDIGRSAGASEHAILSGNCYAVWDPVTSKSDTGAKASAAAKSKFWTLSMGDRTMILPSIEKQVKLDGWQWGGENRTSTDRAYDIIVDLFHAVSTEAMQEHERAGGCESGVVNPEKRVQESIPFTVESPFSHNRKAEAFVNSTRHKKHVLNLGQILPCVSQCSSRLHRSDDTHFVAESEVCKVGLFTELEKRLIAGESGKRARVELTAFYPIEDTQKKTVSPNEAFAVHNKKEKATAPFVDPLDAIGLLDAETLEALDIPEELSLILAEQLDSAFAELSGHNTTKTTIKTDNARYEKKLIEWFRSLRNVHSSALPAFIQKILPHAEIIPDPHSPFKKNVICVPPSLNFHWDLQRSEGVVDRDSVYAKSMAQFYKAIHEAQGGRFGPQNDRTKAVHRHFRHEVRKNHFLFSHHSPGNVFKEKRGQSSAQPPRDWALPVVPKDPFAQSVLPFPDSIRGKHDLSEDFHPFRFPRSAEDIARDIFLNDRVGVETSAPTLMEGVTSPMLLLSFLKHISTVALGTYLYDFLHPDMPCTSIVYSESRGEFHNDPKDGKFMAPSFLNELPTKNDIFVTVNGASPVTMLVPPHARDPTRITNALQTQYASLFTGQMEMLYERWNGIVHKWEEAEGRDGLESSNSFQPPIFLDFPGQSWTLTESNASAKIMPLLQEVVRPPSAAGIADEPKRMVLVNVYCPCEPLRESAWTVMSPSCVRVYRSADSTCLYAQNPETKEFFVVNAADGAPVTFPDVSKPVSDRYFGLMPQAFSAKYAFSGRNQTSADGLGQYDSHDGKVISVAAENVREHTPLSCASQCQPLHFGPAGAKRDKWYSALFTNNFCQAGVAVNMRQ